MAPNTKKHPRCCCFWPVAPFLSTKKTAWLTCTFLSVKMLCVSRAQKALVAELFEVKEARNVMKAQHPKAKPPRIPARAIDGSRQHGRPNKNIGNKNTTSIISRVKTVCQCLSYLLPLEQIFTSLQFHPQIQHVHSRCYPGFHVPANPGWWQTAHVPRVNRCLPTIPVWFPLRTK